MRFLIIANLALLLFLQVTAMVALIAIQKWYEADTVRDEEEDAL